MAVGDMGPGLSSPFQSPSYNNPTSSGGGVGGDSSTAFGDNALTVGQIVGPLAVIAGFVGGFAAGYIVSGGNLVKATVAGVANVVAGYTIYSGVQNVYQGIAHLVRNNEQTLGVLNDASKHIAWTGRGLALRND